MEDGLKLPLPHASEPWTPTYSEAPTCYTVVLPRLQARTGLQFGAKRN